MPYIYFQIRRYYGSQDEIVTVEDRKMRHCNWVRFLKTSDVIDDANVVGVRAKHETVFQVTRTVLPNEEIVAYLHREGSPLSLTDVLRSSTQNATSTPDVRKGKHSHD